MDEKNEKEMSPEEEVNELLRKLIPKVTMSSLKRRDMELKTRESLKVVNHYLDGVLSLVEFAKKRPDIQDIATAMLPEFHYGLLCLKHALRCVEHSKGYVVMYDITELERVTGISARTLRDHAKKGTLVAKKVGGKWYITQESFDEFLEAGAKAHLQPRPRMEE